MDLEERVSRLDERRTAPPAPRSRVRIAVTAVLLAGLALAWLSFARGSSPTAARLLTNDSSRETRSELRANTAHLRAVFADAANCTDVSAGTPALSCEIDGVHVDARLYSVSEAPAVYAKRLSVRIRPGRGPAACARGIAEERSWSRPSAPAVAVGRYRCRVEAGRAALWWTDEHGVVAHAVGADRDLMRLFRWWLVHRDA